MSTKLDYIRAYLDRLRTSVQFLDELQRDGHKREAITLCLVYIDRLAQRLGSGGPGENFRNALINCSQDPLMKLAHPLEAVRHFKRTKNKLWHLIAAKVAAVYPGPSYELLELSDFEAEMAAHLTANEFAEFKRESWRATLASIAYEYLRNDAIHGYGSTMELEFSGTTFNGDPVPSLDLQRLKGCAFALIDEALHRSESNTIDW